MSRMGMPTGSLRPSRTRAVTVILARGCNARAVPISDGGTTRYSNAFSEFGPRARMYGSSSASPWRSGSAVCSARNSTFHITIFPRVPAGSALRSAALKFARNAVSAGTSTESGTHPSMRTRDQPRSRAITSTFAVFCNCPIAADDGASRSTDGTPRLYESLLAAGATAADAAAGVGDGDGDFAREAAWAPSGAPDRVAAATTNAANATRTARPTVSVRTIVESDTHGTNPPPFWCTFTYR